MTPPDTSAPAVEAMIARLLTTAKLLYANAVGCAVNHYGEDFVRFHGKPGWLSDCEQDILDAEEAADMLAAQAAEIERLTRDRDAAREALAKALPDEPTDAMLSAAAGALRAHINALPPEVRAKSKEKGGTVLVGPTEKHAIRYRAMVAEFRRARKEPTP